MAWQPFSVSASGTDRPGLPVKASVTAKGLRKEALQPPGPRHDQAVARAQLLDAEKGDDVLQLLVMRNRLANLFGNAVVFLAESSMGRRQDTSPRPPLIGTCTIMLSRWLEMAVTVGSVKSSAGT
jgi:hypothetical protein